MHSNITILGGRMALRRCALHLASESWPLRIGSWASSSPLRSSSTAAAGPSSTKDDDSRKAAVRAGGVCLEPFPADDDDAQGTTHNGRVQVGRLLYRAKQRGFLEMDLLVGLWAQANLPRMDAAQLAAFEVRMLFFCVQ